MQEGIIAKCIIAYYEIFENEENKKAFTMNDVLAVTMYNQGRAKNERRLKCEIKKLQTEMCYRFLLTGLINAYIIVFL